MLCSLAELGWDSSVTDRVALLDSSIGLRPGESLDKRSGDWRSIVLQIGLSEAPRRVLTPWQQAAAVSLIIELPTDTTTNDHRTVIRDLTDAR